MQSQSKGDDPCIVLVFIMDLNNYVLVMIAKPFHKDIDSSNVMRIWLHTKTKREKRSSTQNLWNAKKIIYLPIAKRKQFTPSFYENK